MAKIELDIETKTRIARIAAACKFDPLKWAEAAFPWGRKDTTLEKEALRTWQREILALIRDHISNPETRHKPLRIAIASGHGIGKAQPLDMTLDTPLGPRRWGDLAVGDLLHGPHGPVRITEVHEAQRRECVRVRLDDGTETVCDADHLWTVRLPVRRGASPWQTMTAAEIAAELAAHGNGLHDTASLRFALPLIREPVTYTTGAPPRSSNRVQARYAPDPQPTADPLLLGWWLTRGVADTSRVVGLTMAEAENLTALCPRGEARAEFGQWTANLPSLRVPLSAAGLIPTQTTRPIPPHWLRQPPMWRFMLLKGIVQGAGSPSGNRATLRVQDSALRASVVWLVNGLGGRTTPMTGGRLSIAMPRDLSLFDTELPPPTDADLTRHIVSVAYAGTHAVRCVTVDQPDGLYLTSDLIVTHNSAGMSIIGNWALSCWRKARIVVTANTDGQLRTKTSPEFAKWAKMSITAPLLDIDTLRISMNDPAFKENWRLDFSSWSEHNTEAFQGLHNKGSLLAILVDEGSAIADTVFDVIEGAMTDSDTVLLLIVFGNPTRNDGRFREFWRRERNRWITRQIDSRTVEGVNKAELDAWAAEKGEDSDYIRVRVRGMFPRASTRQFIPEDFVDDAMRRHLRDDQYAFAPIILSCDPAWTGEDELVIGYRQGLFFDILETITGHGHGHGADVAVAQRLAHYETKYGASAVFIDAGYGTGIKSAGDVMGRAWQLVWFAGKSSDPGFLNKRAEIWGATRKWLELGGALPDDPVLRQDLIGPTTIPRLDGVIALESKEDMRKRKVPSPNRADALALTFAAPVVKSSVAGYAAAQQASAETVQPYTHDPFGG